MNSVAMVAVVIAISQAIKTFLRKWIAVEGIGSVVLVVVVTVGTVAYKFATEGLVFEIAAFLTVVAEVAFLAVGGKLTATSIARKVGGN